MSLFRPRAAALSVLVGIASLALPMAMLAPGAHAQTPASKVSVTITSIKKPQGKMMIAMFDQAGYEQDGPAIANAAVDVTGDTVTVDLPATAGWYGIKLFHDVNGDGKMNANPFGIPNEPYAFSNNAKGSMGPAKWDAARFEVGATGAQQSIKLN